MFNKNKVPRQARGSTAANDKYLGNAGQLTVDLGKFTIRVHDGSTVGGHPLAKEAIAISAVSPLEITQGGTLAENTEIGLNVEELVSTDEDNILEIGSDGGVKVPATVMDASVIGRVFLYSGSDTPKGSLPLDGSFLDARTDYPEFFTWVSQNAPKCSLSEFESSVARYGQCGMYGFDGPGGQVRLPLVKSYIIGTVSDGTLGAVQEAAIPNITASANFSGSTDTGELVGFGRLDNDSTGAFFGSGNTSRTFAEDLSDTEAGNYQLNFDASRSSNVYSNTANTVLTDAIKYRWFVRVEPVKDSAGTWVPIAETFSETHPDGVLGGVIPDGDSILVNNKGVISAHIDLATAESPGLVQPDGVTINVTNGQISVPVYKGATASTAGVKGLVPAAAAGENAAFLRGDGTWQDVEVYKGATAGAAGVKGLVPAAAAGRQNSFLRGDGTWQRAVTSINGQAPTADGSLTIQGYSIFSGAVWLSGFTTNAITLPAGGTWATIWFNWGTDWGEPIVATYPGGTVLNKSWNRQSVFAIRIA